MNALLDPMVEALWHKVVASWDDDGVHQAFLTACQEASKLGDAAVRYRGMLGDPERRATAERKLNAIAALAMLSLESTREEPEAPRWARRVLWLVVGLLLLLLGYGLHMVWLA